MKQVITKAGLCTLLGVAFLSLGLGACKKDTPAPTPTPIPTPPSPQPGDDTELPKGTLGYITKVLDSRPGVGQFTNKLPKHEARESQQTMNMKILESTGNNQKELITLRTRGG